jgi:hypothetical protein
MRAKTTVVLMLMLAGLVVTGCSDDATPSDAVAGGDGPATDQGPLPDGQPDAPPVLCQGCAASEGCVSVEVSLAADDSKQPWKVWPTEADGVGTLVVSAFDPGSSKLVRVTLSNVDVKLGPQTALLNCVPAVTVEVRAFLDDNNNAQPDAYYSADYRDSCPPAPRKVDVAVSAGSTASASIQLAQSCD